MGILNLVSLLGLVGLCAVAWLFSENRRLIPWRVILCGLGLQLALGFLIFYFAPTRIALNHLSRLLDSLFLAADKGSQFIFGPDLVPTPDRPAAMTLRGLFAFRNLPPVIFFSGFMALLYRVGAIQPVVNFFAKIFYRTMRLSGAEALSGSANIFVGIEAAIVVRPFIGRMSRSELCAILACCFGTAASSVLAIYVKALQGVFPNILMHLVSASIIAIPACFVLSKILVPETEPPLTAGGIPPEDHKADPHAERESYFDAAFVGAMDGVKMVVAIVAVLILIIGGVSLLNQLFAALAGLADSRVAALQPVGRLFRVVTLQNLLGAVFYPLTLLLGVAWSESWQASVLIGRRLLETAIPSYQELGRLAAAGQLSPRTVVIVSYALSGFAHIASMGIFVGGLAALAPERRRDVAALGWKALFVGTLATLMIACIAGVFFDSSNPSILGRGASAAAHASSTHIDAHAGVAATTTLDLMALAATPELAKRHGLPDAVEVAVDDSVYHRQKRYRGYPLAALLRAAVAKLDTFDPHHTEVAFRCVDGYAPSAPLAKALDPKAYIVFADLDAKGSGSPTGPWEPFLHGAIKTTPAPFYVVWRDVKGSDTSYPWPYNVVSLELIQFDVLYKGAYPTAAHPGHSDVPLARAQAGFRVFKDFCIRCHAVNRVGGTFGPELNSPRGVADYWKLDELKKFISNPASVRAGSRMPAISGVTPAHVDAIVDYLRYIAP